MTDYETYDKCKECGGDKTAYNTKKEQWICDNRSCSESPMNKKLTYMV